MLREFGPSEMAAADENAPLSAPSPLPWIGVRPGHPYFFTDRSDTWTPIGHNDAITWPELAGLFKRRDVERVEQHLRGLKASGVTCLRLMLEYCQAEHRYIERPVGTFAPNMVRLWDDLFALCERVGIYILLTPFDTFFTWIRWKQHPYNRANGGPCASPRELLTCPATIAAIKARLEFATRRWGGSPALFAWDIWNEMHPAHAGDSVEPLGRFIDEVAPWLKALEQRLHGRRHPVTVSVFGPELAASPALKEPIFRHPELDFANIHLYERGTIDKPRNTVAPALATGRLMASALAEIRDQRPLFDSEHGPIHAFLDKKIVLPEAFDDEYFRHIQWAHLASGGAGGGMRWPNRHPHVLTPGMRRAQAALSRFLPLIDWTSFDRRCWNDALELSAKGFAAFGCGDESQAVLWLLRTDATGRDGRIKADARPRDVMLICPASGDGPRRISFFDTVSGAVIGSTTAHAMAGKIAIPVKRVTADVAIAVRA
jgi:mannan endo-1,4-beta-mannosidase